MDDHSFDRLARRLGQSDSRRSVVKSLLGIGAVTATAVVAHSPVGAARRGFTGPKFPCTPNCDGLNCGSNGCGGTCACAAGRICLPNGTCGLPCVSSPPCQQQDRKSVV